LQNHRDQLLAFAWQLDEDWPDSSLGNNPVPVRGELGFL
jgi:hypothetical protein